MDYTVTRADASQPLQYCTDAFNHIISQCITGGNYWGGRWSLSGFSYSIYNSTHDQNPNNPLGPNHAGGPTASLSNPGTSPGNGNPNPDSNTGNSNPSAGNPNLGLNPGSNNPNGGAPVVGQTVITEVDPQGSTVVETVRHTLSFRRTDLLTTDQVRSNHSFRICKFDFYYINLHNSDLERHTIRRSLGHRTIRRRIWQDSNPKEPLKKPKHLTNLSSHQRRASPSR
jgi:hypothetical protein